MYSLGTAPPLISLTKVKPLLGSPGSNLRAGCNASLSDDHTHSRTGTLSRYLTAP